VLAGDDELDTLSHPAPEERKREIDQVIDIVDREREANALRNRHDTVDALLTRPVLQEDGRARPQDENDEQEDEQTHDR